MKEQFSPLLTPAQNQLFYDDRLKELRDRLGLEPIITPEVILQNKVNARIKEWFSQFSNPNHIEPPQMFKYKSSITGIVYESPF